MRRRAANRGRVVVVAVLVVAVLVGAAVIVAHHRDRPARGPAQAPRIIGWLHTHGHQIVQGDGRPVRLMGINVGSLAQGDGPPRTSPETGCPAWTLPPSSEYDNIARWGFNSVRVPISWANLEPSPPKENASGAILHEYNTRYLNAIGTVVAQFGSLGIAVVLDMTQAAWSPAFVNIRGQFGVHCQGVGMPAWLYPDASTSGPAEAERSFFLNEGNVQAGFVAAWREVARRFANNRTVVGFDLLNEPYGHGVISPATMNLGALYDRVGRAIRAVDPHVLLIFQDSNYNLAGDYALTGPPSLHNVVYSMHFYETNWVPDGRTRMLAYERRADAWGVPLYVGEFDEFGYGSPQPVDPRWRQDLIDMLTFCRVHDISWNIFSYARRFFLEPGTDQPKSGVLQVLQTDFATSDRRPPPRVGGLIGGSLLPTVGLS